MKPDMLLRRGVLALAAFTALWWLTCLGKPLRGDQVLFESAALGILKHGYPLMEYGLGFVNLGLWHPPLFFAEQALFTLLTRSVELGARLPAVLGLMVSLWLGVRALRSWGLRAEVWGFALLFLGSAAIVAEGLIPDHDSALVLPASVGLALLAVDSLRRKTPVPLWSATAWVFLAFWGKLTTPPIYLGAWILAWAYLRGPRRAAIEAALPAILGLAAFWATYLAYSAAFHLNPIYTLEYMTWAKLGASATFNARLLALASGIWVLGLPLVLLMGVSWSQGPRIPWRRQSALLLLVLALAPLLAFSFVSPYLTVYPYNWKYLLPSRVLLALAIALLWPGKLMERAIKGPELRLATIGAAILLAGLWVVRGHIGLRVAATVAALTFGACLAFAVSRSRWDARLVAAALSVLLAEAVFFGAFQLSQSRDSPVEFNTGERGFQAVIQALKDPRFEGATFLCRKDVAFYTPGRKAIPMDPHFYLDPRVPIAIPLAVRPKAQALAKAWPFAVADWTIHASYERAFVNDLPTLTAYLDHDVDWVIDSEYDSFLREPALRALVEARFAREPERIGDYAFYRRKVPKLQRGP